jgi:dGTPase
MSKFADYAVTKEYSKGRTSPEKPHLYRSPFERDRDRVIHCSAFRRLEGKTQVFTPGLDDHYRTRLTHSIEVAQIGKTVAKVLGLNQNLTEAICLAHDLGHSPFGHTGEKVLNCLMADLGGFEHNRQSLRIVDVLEHPYPDVGGLNLMYETRLGLAKHSSSFDHPDVAAFSENQCSAEGQIADLADRIAYNCHDLEDGLRAGIITSRQLKNVEIYRLAGEKANVSHIADASIASTRIAKTIIDMLVSDCIETSRKKLKDSEIRTACDIYISPEKMIDLSEINENRLCELEEFLLNNFYLHADIKEMQADIESWLGRLFDHYRSHSELMPPYFQQLLEEAGTERVTIDYIAGMTDRFCLKMLEEI